MAPKIVNSSGQDDAQEGWKSYYLRVQADGGKFYKIGICKGSVKKRYSREPTETEIEILKIWPHAKESVAVRHEQQLFKTYPGDRPFIGRCGPFRYGGNTETFSHDVIGGERGPHSFVARMYSMRHGILHTTGYSGTNPRARYSHLYGTVRYMDYLFGPKDVGEGEFYQIPALSAPDRIVIATERYLEHMLEHTTPSDRIFPKRLAQDALQNPILVRWWTDYDLMRFEGRPFKVDRWTDWV